ADHDLCTGAVGREDPFDVAVGVGGIRRASMERDDARAVQRRRTEHLERAAAERPAETDALDVAAARRRDDDRAPAARALRVDVAGGEGHVAGPVHVPKTPALGAGSPSVATVAWLIGSVMCATTIVSVTLPPVSWLRNAIHPSPAAVGQPVKPGPVNTPPPGAASPIAATSVFEV